MSNIGQRTEQYLKSASLIEHTSAGTYREQLIDFHGLWEYAISVEGRESEDKQIRSKSDTDSTFEQDHSAFSRLIYVPYDWGHGEYFHVDMSLQR